MTSGSVLLPTWEHFLGLGQSWCIVELATGMQLQTSEPSSLVFLLHYPGLGNKTDLNLALVRSEDIPRETGSPVHVCAGLGGIHAHRQGAV